MTGYAFALSPAEDCYTAPQHLFQLLRIIEALVTADRPFRSALSRGIGHLDRILSAYGLALDDATELNIEKLKRHYPGRFTLAHARMHDSQ